MNESLELFRIRLFPAANIFTDDYIKERREQLLGDLRCLLPTYSDLLYTNEHSCNIVENGYMVAVIYISLREQASLALDADAPILVAGQSTVPLLQFIKDKFRSDVEDLPIRFHAIVFESVQQASFNNYVYQYRSEKEKQLRHLIYKNQGDSLALEIDTRQFQINFPEMPRTIVDNSLHRISAKVVGLKGSKILLKNIVGNTAPLSKSNSTEFPLLLSASQVNSGYNFIFVEAMHQRALIELDVEAFLHATEKHVVAYQLITFNNMSQLIASAKLRAGGL